MGDLLRTNKNSKLRNIKMFSIKLMIGAYVLAAGVNATTRLQSPGLAERLSSHASGHRRLSKGETGKPGNYSKGVGGETDYVKPTDPTLLSPPRRLLGKGKEPTNYRRRLVVQGERPVIPGVNRGNQDY